MLLDKLKLDIPENFVRMNWRNKARIIGFLLSAKADNMQNRKHFLKQLAKKY